MFINTFLVGHLRPFNMLRGFKLQNSTWRQKQRGGEGVDPLGSPAGPLGQSELSSAPSNSSNSSPPPIPSFSPFLFFIKFDFDTKTVYGEQMDCLGG